MGYPLIKYPIIYSVDRVVSIGETFTVNFSIVSNWIITATDEISVEGGELNGFSDSVTITALKPSPSITINIVTSLNYMGLRNGVDWVDSDMDGNLDYWVVSNKANLDSINGETYGFDGESGLITPNTEESLGVMAIYQTDVAPTKGTITYSGKYRSTRPISVGIIGNTKTYPATENAYADPIYILFTEDGGKIYLDVDGVTSDHYLTYTDNTYEENLASYEKVNLLEGYNAFYTENFDGVKLIHGQNSIMMVDTSFIPSGISHYEIYGDNLTGNIENLYFIKDKLIVYSPITQNTSTLITGNIEALSGISEEITINDNRNISGDLITLIAPKLDLQGTSVTGQVPTTTMYANLNNCPTIPGTVLGSSLIGLANEGNHDGTFIAKENMAEVVDPPNGDQNNQSCAAVQELRDRGWYIDVNINCEGPY